MSRGRSWYISAVGVAVVALAASACGSGSSYSAPSVEHPVVLPAQQPLEKQVDSMVLTGGDIAGWKIVSRKTEGISDQLAPAGSQGGAELNRFTRAHWKGSYHTVLSHSGEAVLSTANVYDSTESAQHVRDLVHKVRIRGYVVHDLTGPDNAPPGARFYYFEQAGHSGYVLNWTQGSVFSLVMIVNDRPSSASEAQRAGRLLAVAADTQADRISKVIEAHASAMAAK